MIYDESKNHLLKQGSIKKCPVDYKAVTNLIKRAYVDLKTAERNLESDEECAYNYAYNAMLHSGLALMFAEGFRPEIKGKHLIIVKYVNAVSGKEFAKIINDYDFMRRKRNKFIYEPGIPCSVKEAKDAIKTAKQFVSEISKLIRKNNPQKKFGF